MKTMSKVTSLPHRLEYFGMTGWTVREFSDAHAAAQWFQTYQCAAMPCWKRMEVIDGELFLVR